MTTLVQEAIDGTAAGVCVQPEALPSLFLKRIELGGLFRNVTVLNFPGQTERAPAALYKATQEALNARADDIDLVVPRRYFAGNAKKAKNLISACFQAVSENPHSALKIILETGDYFNEKGELDARALEDSSHVCLESDVHFLKTCTGKHPTRPGADPESLVVMCRAIRDFGKHAGIKVSGGVSTLEKADAALKVVSRVLGSDFVTPRHVRLGSSGLLRQGPSAY